MPILAELELLKGGPGHRPHSMALLGIAPGGDPLCNWAQAEEAFETAEALIARRVHKPEIDAKPAAREALAKEKARLEAVPVWDLHNPVSWSATSAKARSSGTKAYIGDIMPLVYEKHAELTGNGPLKVMGPDRVQGRRHQG